MRAIGTSWRVTFGALLLSVASGCAPTGDDSAGTTGEGADALTLADGDRYVVSADPESGKVVLRTSVDGVPLPYDQARMIGKAVLIHPLPGRAERGIYARVTDAHEGGDRLELTTTALTLEEMGALREEEILRIYLARSLPSANSNGALATQGLRLLDATSSTTPNAPSSGWTGVFTGSFPTVWVIPPTPGVGAFIGNVGFATPPAIDFHPEGKLSYSRAAGLEVGLRGSLLATVKLDVHGVAGARAPIFVTPNAALPPVSFLVLIGPVPVPVQVILNGGMRCDMIYGGRVEAIVSLSAKLRFGGSARFHPTRDTDPSQWLTVGDWPYELGADFDADLDGDIEPGVGVSCAAPRVNLDVSIAGLTGPYLALVPEVTALADRIEVRPSLRAGWSSGTLLFGNPGRAEVELLSRTTILPR